MDTTTWKKVKLGDIENLGLITLGRGKIISKKDMQAIPGNYPVYSSSATGDGSIGTYGEYMFDDERITWSVDGGGKLFYRNNHKYSVTNVCGWIKVNDTSKIDTKYLYYALYKEWTEKTFDYLHKAHPSVIREEYEIYLPPIADQIKIAKLLSDFDTLISTTESKSVALQKQKAQIMSDIFNGNGERDSWSVVKLGDICTIKTGKKPAGAAVEDGAYPFFTANTSKNVFIDTYSYDTEAVLVAKDGEYAGHTRYCNGKFDVSNHSFVLTNFKGINVMYLYQFTKHNSELMHSIATGAAIPGISMSALKEVEVPLPPLPEQQQIAKLLSEYDELIAVTNEQADILKKSKTQIMSDIFA